MKAQDLVNSGWEAQILMPCTAFSASLPAQPAEIQLLTAAGGKAVCNAPQSYILHLCFQVMYPMKMQ